MCISRQKQNKEVDLKAIKNIGKELIADPSTGDKNRLRETMADVQSKWHDLTELLVQMISFAVSIECYFFSVAFNEMIFSLVYTDTDSGIGILMKSIIQNLALYVILFCAFLVQIGPERDR